MFLIVNYLISFFNYGFYGLYKFHFDEYFRQIRVIRSFSYSIHDFLKSAVIIPEVHLHLFYSGFAFVVRVGLRVQQNGNHLVGETVLGEAADAHIPLAEFGVELQQPLREAVEDQVR